MADWLFLTSSARPEGNSLQLARRAAAALPASAQRWEDLADPPLPPFADLRGRPEAETPPEGRLAGLAEATLAAREIVLVAPLYWYGLPAPAKLLLDHWSGWLEVPGMDFAERMRGKRLWLVSVRADPAPELARPLEESLRLTARWLDMRWGGALTGIGDAPGDVLRDADALARAARFFLAPEA